MIIIMDNNQEDRTINSSSLTPIDIIDLTNESPIRATQSHKRHLENALATGNNIPMELSHTSTHKSYVSTSYKMFVHIYFLFHFLFNKFKIHICII